MLFGQIESSGTKGKNISQSKIFFRVCCAGGLQGRVAVEGSGVPANGRRRGGAGALPRHYVRAGRKGVSLRGLSQPGAVCARPLRCPLPATLPKGRARVRPLVLPAARQKQTACARPLAALRTSNCAPRARPPSPIRTSRSSGSASRMSSTKSSSCRARAVSARARSPPRFAPGDTCSHARTRAHFRALFSEMCIRARAVGHGACGNGQASRAPRH